MRISLTDANGFIGGAVAFALIAEGRGVRGLVRARPRPTQWRLTTSTRSSVRSTIQRCWRPKPD